MLKKTQDVDIAIVGSGPSGLAAANALRNSGKSIIMIDEQRRTGGQFLRQPPKEFKVKNWLPDPAYKQVKTLAKTMQNANFVSWQFETTVLGIFPAPSGTHKLWLRQNNTTTVLHAKTVILAQGCYERPFPFPGWTEPGIMGAGAIQTLLKSQQIFAGKQMVFSGSHPLQLIVADQIVKAGGHVKCVLFSQKFSKIVSLGLNPKIALRQFPNLLNIALILLRLRLKGVKVLFSHSVISATGDKNQLQSVSYARLGSNGQPDTSNLTHISTDSLGLCYGFLASSELARQAGVKTRWDAENGGWLVVVDEHCQSSVANLYTIGELTGQDGSSAAIEKGKLAAFHILQNQTGLQPSEKERQSTLKKLGRLRAFSRLLNKLSQPPQGLLAFTLKKDTILCRCERITISQFLDQIKHCVGSHRADSAKLRTRVGMGACQGRMCYFNTAQVLAEFHNTDVNSIGPFQAQFPIKPVQLSACTNVEERNTKTLDD